MKWWVWAVALLLLGANLVAYWPHPPLPPNRLRQRVLGRIPVSVRGLAPRDRRNVTAALLYWSRIVDVEWIFTPENAVLLVGSNSSWRYVQGGDRLLYGHPANWIWEAYASPRENLAVFENRFDGPEEDRFFVAVHEIGHLLGLPHSRLKESVMYPEELSEPSRQALTSGDLEMLRCLHGLLQPLHGPLPVETVYQFVRPGQTRTRLPLFADTGVALENTKMITLRFN